MAKRVKIEIKIRYDEETVNDEDELIRGLERELDRAIQDGMLCPTGEVVVDEYSADVSAYEETE